MRIIRGKYKTRYFPVPKGFPSRPTTDFAKEALFNILENGYLQDDMQILDLCAGTGSISFEFLSREYGQVTAVDNHPICLRHLHQLSKQLNCGNDLITIKSDVIKFLQGTNHTTYDLIFTDPPFNFGKYDELVQLVFSGDWLYEDGLLIVEHGKETSLEHITEFQFSRIYGNVHFSFFEKPIDNG